jgi:hypothetical protein
LMKKSDVAIEWFEKAIRDGFSCYPLFEKDSNLDSLRTDSRFRKIMEVERKKWENYRSKFGTSAARADLRIWGAQAAGLLATAVSRRGLFVI